jgi:S1-C subfamily serine protease
VVPALIKDGHFEHPWLGISGTTLTPSLAQAMKLPSSQRGALVGEVSSGSPAEKAGLKGSTETGTVQGQQVPVGGDVIIAIDGQAVKTFDDVTAYLARSTSVGQTVTLTVLRGGQKQDVKVTLEARPSSVQPGTQGSAAPGAAAYLGVTGVSVTPDIAKAMGLAEDVQGVLVQQVDADSPADNAGLQAGSTSATVGGKQMMIGGDIIIGYGSEAVTSVDDLKSFLAQSLPGQRVTLTVVRDGRQGRLRVLLDQQPTSTMQPA